MKSLVIIAHPNMDKSMVNKRWVQELEKYPEEFTIHKLYEFYPDEKIDIEKEQALIESHGSLILQFPIYWFNCPPLMKKWLDEVLTHGWAYGSKGDKFTNRKVALAVTVGIKEKDYSAEGRYNYTLEQVLLPFEMTFNYTKATYKGFKAFYSAEFESTEMRIESSVSGYIDFLKKV